jgi:diguanylate cyclase (GGDEF)-like protein/PAS domain S-box-containing protein
VVTGPRTIRPPSVPRTRDADADAADEVCIRNLLDASDETIYFKDRDSRFLRVSLGMARLHGRTPQAMRGLTDFDLFAEAHAAAALADERQVMRSGVPIVNKEECERFPDRPLRWVATSKFPLRDRDGAIIGTFGISRDITRRVLAEQEMARLSRESLAGGVRLARAEAQLRAVLNGSSDAIAQYDLELRYRYLNPAGERLRGMPLADLVGRTDREIGPDAEAAARWEAALRRVLDTGSPGEHEFSMALPGGEAWFHSTLSPELDDTGAIVGVLTSTRDVSHAKAAERALAHQATHDPLTGLANRYLLMERLEQALRRLDAAAGCVAVVFVDLDRFKAVNDRHGHATGDAVLVELARRLSALAGTGDTVARLGGDEFVMLRSHAGRASEVRELATRVAATLEAPFPVGAGLALRLSASVGAAATGDAGARVADLLREADRAMYRVKQGGRDGVHVAGVAPPAADGCA